MELQLDLAENIPTGIRRLATEQVKLALDQLTASQIDLDERIHTARKSFKKVRAILRLVRDEIGQEIYQQENIAFRDIGRLLAPLRDSAVLIKTIDSISDAIIERFPDQLNMQILKSIRAQLLNHQDRIRQQTINSRVFPQVISSLDQASTRIKRWPVTTNDFSAFHAGLKRVYRRGYRGMDTATNQPTAENLHEWRKRIKYLWYHIRLLRGTWTNVLSEVSSDLHTLSDHLGNDHDLAEFSDKVLHQTEIVSQIDLNTQQTLSDLINTWRSEHQTHAYSLGQRIYAEKPTAFTRRLATYWHAAQSDPTTLSPPTP